MFVLKPNLTVKFLLVLTVVCVILLPPTVASAIDFGVIDRNRATINEINSLNEIKKLKAQAKSGDINAQLSLGRDYHEFRAEEAKAAGLYWYQKAGSLGCARANYEAAMFLSVDSNKNRQQAIPYFEKAVQQGNAEALIPLGDRYALGEGVKKNPLKALSLYKAAGDSGNDDGTGYFLVGYAYYTGQVKPSWNSVTGSPYDELSTGDAYYTQRTSQRASESVRSNYYRHIIKIPIDKKKAFEYMEKSIIQSSEKLYAKDILAMWRGNGEVASKDILIKLYIKEGGLVNLFKAYYWRWSHRFFYNLELVGAIFYPEEEGSPTWQKREQQRHQREQRQLRC